MLFDEIYTYEPPSDFNIGFVMLMIFAGLGRVCGDKRVRQAGPVDEKRKRNRAHGG